MTCSLEPRRTDIPLRRNNLDLGGNKESEKMISSHCMIAVGLLSLTLLGWVGRAAFAETVKVEGGPLQGTVEDGLRIYRGIPFAAPPIGDLRWRPPQPPSKWDGVRAAAQFGRACIQTNAAIADLQAPSEDCLYLNVWTPAT